MIRTARATGAAGYRAFAPTRGDGGPEILPRARIGEGPFQAPSARPLK